MPNYKVEGHVTVSAYTYVYADSPEAARKIAEGRDATLCPNGPERHGASEWETTIIEDGDGSMEVHEVSVTSETDPEADDSEAETL